MESFRKYYMVLILSFLAAMAAVGAFNFLVDPEQVFLFKEIRGFNDQKRHIPPLRTHFSTQLLHGKFDAIILGSSTVQTMQPDHPAFKGHSVLLLPIDGTNMMELFQIFEFALKHQKLSLVVIGLDFHSFFNFRTVSADFEDSFFSKRNPLLIKFSYLFSYSVLKESFKRIRESRRQYLQDQDPNFNEMAIPAPVRDERAAFIQSLVRGFMQAPLTSDGYSEDRVALLKQMMEDCSKNGVQLDVYISPVHALRMESIYITGLWPTYEKWMRDLVSIAEQASAMNPSKPPIRVWDFSGYNSVTTVELPPKDKQGVKMQWWMDFVHMNEDLANIMIDVMRDYHDPSRVRPPDFGVVLTSQNIESRLALMREGHKQYQETHPEEIRETETIALKCKRFEIPGQTLILKFQTNQ
jgi:hypothetical protein